MRRIVKYTGLCFFLLLAVTACEEDAAILNPDVSHNKPTSLETGGLAERLCSDWDGNNQQVFLNVTNREDDRVTDRVSVVLGEAASETKNLTVVVDEDFDVEAFQLAYTNSNYELLPADAYELANGGKLTITAGAMQSDKLSLTFKGWMLPEATNDIESQKRTQYLLPLKIQDEDGYRSLLYRINWTNGTYRLTDPTKGYTCIGYVDTEKMSPLVASVYALQKNFMDPAYESPQLFDVVNLLRATVHTGGELNLNTDISHVLKNADKYIRPLQLMGMKVCLTVKNSAATGFCHLLDVDIENLVVQIKTVVELYGLDGIDLWDDSDGYGTEGVKNTTVYPKLIKALREALPEGKLLTVADKGEATAYFSDKEKCGGIEVGKHIDYAYNGYLGQYSLPFWPELEIPEVEWMISGRKPFAGLEKERFVCFSFDFELDLLTTWGEDMDLIGFIMDMEGMGEDPDGVLVFQETKAFIAYDIPDNVRGREHLTQMPMDTMQPLFDPYYESQIFRSPRGAGAVGNDQDNTYFRKDW
ncbi:DUF1735 domain-containing protein [uncultured Bacteroides sp.]|uniref:BT_3987 domain-containing protein n=1 Tax=uncultured Bacteroides sp. TaxID=162156 RepID=UPI0025D32E96|nr:DUF1735 domain-containing protein [uncultured Bacteroides sp.]